MAHARSESARHNFGKLIHQFQLETKTFIRKLERILIKSHRQNVSLLSNQTCLYERLLPTYTHTHTHIYIYIHVYVCVCAHILCWFSCRYISLTIRDNAMYNTHAYAYIYIYIYIYISLDPLGQGRVFTNGSGDWGSIQGRFIPKTQTWYLMSPCLILSIIKYGSIVK